MSYEEAIDGFRADKDEFFRYSPHSPVPEGERSSFTELPYYSINTALRFDDLILQPYEGDQPSDFQIPTSDNRLRPGARWGAQPVVRRGAGPQRSAANNGGSAQPPRRRAGAKERTGPPGHADAEQVGRR